MRALIRLTALLVLCLAAPALADWSQFLGPNRDATLPDARIDRSWPADGPPVLWTIDTGEGFGGASIRDGEVFLLDRNSEVGDVLRVFDLKTGDEKWRYAYEAKGKLSYAGSRSTPTVDEEHVYTVGGFGQLHCISRKTHKPVWSIDLGKQWEAGELKWGYAQSPLLYKDTLIVSPTAGNTPVLAALNKNTGQVVWQSEAPTPGGKYDHSDYYSSPVLRTVNGKLGLLQITNNQVSFINPDNGKMIWRYNGYSVKFAIPSPTVLPDGQRIFITRGYDDGSVMIKVVPTAAGYQFEELFRFKGDGSQLHPALNYKGMLYVNINENSKFNRAGRRQGGLACIDPDKGEIVWRAGEDPFFSRGNLLLLGDLIVMLEGDKGSLHLIEPNAKGYKELSRAQVLKAQGEKVWAPMAYTDGLLIVRDQNQMKCLRIGESKLVSSAE